MSVLGLDSGYTVKYNPLPSEFPWALPSGTPSGKGLYLTVYPSSRPNTDTVCFTKLWGVTFLGYLTLPSQGNLTQTDVVYPAWVWLPSKCCKHCICTKITLFCRDFKIDVIRSLSGKIWKRTILLG